MSIFEKLKGLSKKESKDNPIYRLTDKPLPSYTYLDENNQIKEIPLSKDSAGAMVIEDSQDSQNKIKKKKSPAKLIRDSIFGK